MLPLAKKGIIFMKNILRNTVLKYTIPSMLSLLFLMGCSEQQADNISMAGEHEVTLRLQPGTTMNGESAEQAQTRAAISCDRYLIEVYADDTYTTPANVFGTDRKSVV